MTKASTIQDQVEEDAEIEQYEQSVVLAADFLDTDILPLLDEFEDNNEDPEYMYGVATHGLFVELIMRLADMGYTEKELKKEIKIYMNSSFGQTVH